MSGPPTRRLALPIDTELRSASPWVWVSLALAALWIADSILSPQQSLSSELGSILFATPALVAAALLFVAPRERMVRVSAFGFAFPVAFLLIRDALSPIDAVLNDNRDWALLGQRLFEWTDAISSVTWVFGIVAVLALAFYLGPIRSRSGWLIVFGSAVLAVALATVYINNWLSLVDQIGGGLILAGSDQPSLLDLAFGILSQLVIVGWGYLLAVTYERHMRLLALGALARLVLSLVGLLSVTILFDSMQQDTSGGLATLLSLTNDVVLIVYVLTFIGGVLTELPRHGRIPAADDRAGSASSAEVFSAGR